MIRMDIVCVWRRRLLEGCVVLGLKEWRLRRIVFKCELNDLENVDLFLQRWHVLGDRLEK